MKKSLILGCLFTLLVFGCKPNSPFIITHTLIASTDSVIKIHIDNNSTNLSICTQFICHNDTNYIALLNRNYNKIMIYNLDSKKLYNVINLKQNGPNSFPLIYGFAFKKLDTILAVSTYPQLVGIIGKNGTVLKKISYARDINDNIVYPSNAALGNHPILVGDSIYLIQSIISDESSMFLTLDKIEHTSVNISLNIKTGKCKLSPLKIPVDLKDKDIVGLNAFREIGYSNSFIYYYNLLNFLYVTKDFLTFNKIPIQTNYNLKVKKNIRKFVHSTFEKAVKNYLAGDEILDIHYDKFRECYYLVVSKRSTNFDKNADYRLELNYPQFMIIMLDKNLNYMGDVYFPKDTYSCKMMFITKKGLFISEDNLNNSEFDEDYLRFRQFNLIKLKEK